MVLRLHELPPEYTIGDDTGCGVYGTEGESSTQIEEFAIRYRPLTCDYEYERRFELPGTGPTAPLVDSLAIGTGTVAAAEAGLAIGSELIGATVGTPGLTPVPAAERIGDATVLFHSDRALVAGRSGRAASALLWRSGPTLAAIYVAGLPTAAGDALALSLARIQQRHVEAPTPYLPSERGDRLVPLEDPGARTPVYWLGATFRPGHGLPPSTLLDAAFNPGGPLGMKLLLSYNRISLSTYTRGGWNRRLRSSLGELVRGWRCTDSERISVPHGSATVYAGYGKDYAACPRRRPNVFFAEVHLGRYVVGVDLPNCEYCIEPGHGPYYSLPDMKLIARSLRLRNRPGG